MLVFLSRGFAKGVIGMLLPILCR